MRLAGLAACAVAVAACEAPVEVAECPNMAVKGWDALMRSPAFTPLSHRREQRFDPMSEMSQVLWSDSSYSYERLLTFDIAHPRFAEGVPEERCIRGVSFMAATPLQGARGESLDAFVAFLRSHGASPELVKAIGSARERQAPLAPVGTIGSSPVSAGVIVHGARGSFFRMEVGATK